MYPYEIDIEKSDIHFEASGNYLIMKVKKGVISGSNPIDEIHLSQNYLFGYIQIIRREKAREQEVIPIASPVHVESMRACRVEVDSKYTALKNRVSAGNAWGSLIEEREALDVAIDNYIKSISKAELFSSLSSATTNGLIAQAKSILANATATTDRMNGQHDTIIQTHKVKPNVLEQLNTARLNLRNALIDLDRAVNDFCLSKPTQEIFDNNILPTHKEFKRQVRLYQTAITIATGGHAGLEGLTAIQISQADARVETAHNTLSQLAAQHTEVVARRRFTQAALSDLNAKKQALTDAVATLKTKVDAFKQSEEITEASYQTSVKPFVDAYTTAMEAYQAAITKADEGKDGASVRPNLIRWGDNLHEFQSTAHHGYVHITQLTDGRRGWVFNRLKNATYHIRINVANGIHAGTKYAFSFNTTAQEANLYRFIQIATTNYTTYGGLSTLLSVDHGQYRRSTFVFTAKDDAAFLMFYAHELKKDGSGEYPPMTFEYWDFKLEEIPQGEEAIPTAYIPHVGDLKGEQGIQPITLTLSEQAMIVKNNKGIRTLSPLLAHNGEDITAYSIATLGVIYRWRRQSPNGVDKKGKTDATWESQNVGRASIQIDTTEVWDETKFSVGMDKASADKIQNYIKTRK